MPSTPATNTRFFSKHVARVLGIAGLLPFLLMSLATWLVPLEMLPQIVRSQIGYGIAVLSFLGGIHWGGALATGTLSVAQTKKALAWGVLPSFIAFTALPVDTGFAFAVLTIGFAASYQIDKHLYQWYKMPEWMLRLRFKLTCITVLALAATFLAVNVRNL